MAYNLCWASGKGIERSYTEHLAEAQIMAKIMSASTQDQTAQTIMIVDDDADVVNFYRDGIKFIKEV